MNTTKENRTRMQCMEIWGGNQSIDRHFEATGIELIVNSVPYNESELGGGDIYYLTSCASGRISRFLLADVSGHGEAAADVAISLRDLMRGSVNSMNQERFVTNMNREFGSLAAGDAFATAVVATYFSPTRKLTVSVAGHPYPFFYRQSEKRWCRMDPTVHEGQIENLPLGVHDDSGFPGTKIEVHPDDCVLFYSDAFSESRNEKGEMLGVNGFQELLNRLVEVPPSELLTTLRSELQTMNPENLLDDDATLILGKFTQGRVRFRDNLYAPFRLFQGVKDRTEIRFSREGETESAT